MAKLKRKLAGSVENVTADFSSLIVHCNNNVFVYLFRVIKAQLKTPLLVLATRDNKLRKGNLLQIRQIIN